MKQQLTKLAIQSAFYKMLRKKPFDKITVRDIVEDCGLTRNTFYYYYQDIYDILDGILDSAVQDAVSSCRTPEDWDGVLTQMCDIIAGNTAAITHLMQSQHRDELHRCFDGAVTSAVGAYIALCSEKWDIRDSDRILLCDTLRYTIEGILLDWIKSGAEATVAPQLIRLRGMLSEALDHQPSP